MNTPGMYQERQATKPVAWVTLVLGLDLSYVAAAAVMASALKRLGTRGECVCMVTPDVPEAARAFLRRIFDQVAEVPYLETLALQKYSERFDGMYNYWLDKSFTKCAMFAMVEYEKVIFLDADMLPVKNPDELFDCPAPAGICSSVKDASENSRLHGMPLPRLLIDESLKNGQGHYGVRGCLLIMKPDLNVYHQIRSEVETVASYGSLESMVGPDEYLITKHFCDQWHHIHAKYGWVSWADRQDLGDDPCMLHFVSQKPWDEGEAWSDFEYWKLEAADLLKKCPDAIVYFSHITEAMAEMAGINLTDEKRSIAKGLMHDAVDKKRSEKARREERAKELGIDLTGVGLGSRGSASSSWRRTVHEQSVPLSPKSARGPSYSLPQHVAVQPPNSARLSQEKKEETVVKKVSPNVLMVSNFKRPTGTNKPSNNRHKLATKGKNPPPSNNASNKEPTVLVKPTVPKLNLEGVHDDDIPKGGWNSGHWKKKTPESKADGEHWRAPSARLATPDRPTEDRRPCSARNWPGTPTSTSLSARKNTAAHIQHIPRHAQTPKSSRADLATSWRSTPRTDLPEQHFQRQSPPRGHTHRESFCNNFPERRVDRDFCGNHGIAETQPPTHVAFPTSTPGPTNTATHPSNLAQF